jgi:hypothetical protein
MVDERLNRASELDRGVVGCWPLGEEAHCHDEVWGQRSIGLVETACQRLRFHNGSHQPASAKGTLVLTVSTCSGR